MSTARASSAASDILLQPLTIPGLTLKCRIMSTAHASGADDGSMPKLRFQRYHEEKAIVFASGIVPGHSILHLPDKDGESQPDDIAQQHLNKFLIKAPKRLDWATISK